MFSNAKPINLQHQRLWLLPQKAVYWQKRKTLLIADLHIGKSGHFRKNGIPVPPQINTENLDTIDMMLDELHPRHIIFLGDLFHSRFNKEWHQFKKWRKNYPNLEVTLVIGNHDILQRDNYHASHISVFKRLKVEPFLFLHDVQKAPQKVCESPHYLLGGHVHPALSLRGKGRQNMKFPCFYFGASAGILPAFGQFTGTAVIKPAETDRTYFIVDEQVISLADVA